MKVGYTGPRLGMSPYQLEQLLIELHRAGATEFHHGDCRGGDEQAHGVARGLGLRIVGHPPSGRGLRAFCECDEMMPEQEYLVRNRDIVLSTQLLIATPDGPERRRSGTWSTIRYARRIGASLLLIPVANPELSPAALSAKKVSIIGHAPARTSRTTHVPQPQKGPTAGETIF